MDLYSNDAKYHLWYLYAAIGLYLALPLFRVFVRHAKRQEILYVILVSFGISAVATTVDKIYGIKAPVGFEYFLGYGSFLLLGYYMAKFEIKYSRLIYLMGALAIFVTIIGTWYVSSLQNDLNQVFYEYLSFTTPIAAGALFLYMKNHDSNKVSNVIAKLSKYSFGIYLIHPIFIDLLRSEELESLFNFSVNQLPTLLNILLTLVLATIFSILIAKLLSRIPVLKKLV
ncbi:acyltransferase [Piscibacillus salipiscarius]|uniref:acyltransferase n=1 Tax=Piscibacillus salipiscarius TaxID=299480 RepID=UPI00243662E9|nr:acyltransferase family protein [Piscibacillus salipiscarius]